MMMSVRMSGAILGLLLGCGGIAPGAIQLVVTVVEQKTGRPVTDVKAEEFTIYEDKLVRRVEGAEFGRKPVDVMLLVDTSLVGGIVQPLVTQFIGGLAEKEQMAIVGYAGSADLIQDFTSSKELLGQALGKVKYGNTPRVLDALYAAMDGGFESTVYRRVILLLTAGYEGDSRVTEMDVVRLARKFGVSIYPVYATGRERGLFERLAQKTGGASFSLRDLDKSGSKEPAVRVFEAVRGVYTVTITGNLGIGDKVKAEVNRPAKLRVSVMPID
jgi:hypothetical protein